MEDPTSPDPEDSVSAPAGAPVVGHARWRDFSPVESRSQRMHRFTGRLLAAVGDATAGGVDGVAVGCLNARKAGESVLELREAMARLQGLELALLARTEVRLATDLTEGYAATGSPLLAGDIDAAQAEIVIRAVKRLPATVGSEVRTKAERLMLEEAQHLDAAQLRVAGRRLLEVIDPDTAEATEAMHSLSEAISRTVGVEDPTTGDPVPHPKPGPRVMGEAFCRLLETLDADRLPHSGGLNATVVVTIPLGTLRGGLAAATMDTGTRLSPGEARRMACDAGLHPVVLGGQSEILDFGRKRRLFSKPQRAAMAVRQRFRCAAEGCDRPTAWCDAHHVNPWVPGGRTDLADGVLLCGRHHRLAHHPDYSVSRRP